MRQIRWLFVWGGAEIAVALGIVVIGLALITCLALWAVFDMPLMLAGLWFFAQTALAMLLILPFFSVLFALEVMKENAKYHGY